MEYYMEYYKWFKRTKYDEVYLPGIYGTQPFILGSLYIYDKDVALKDGLGKTEKLDGFWAYKTRKGILDFFLEEYAMGDVDKAKNRLNELIANPPAIMVVTHGDFGVAVDDMSSVALNGMRLERELPSISEREILEYWASGPHESEVSAWAKAELKRGESVRSMFTGKSSDDIVYAINILYKMLREIQRKE